MNPFKRRAFLLPLDLALIVVSRITAYWIRFEGPIPPEHWRAFWVGLWVSLVVIPAVFVLSGFYRRLWRYASVPDLIQIVKATAIASCVATFAIVFITQDASYPRSIPILAWMILTSLILTRSLVWRLTQEVAYRKEDRAGVPTLIVGAGMGGNKLLQEIRRGGTTMPYAVVGLLDDDRSKIGCEIAGRPVLGAISDLRRVARETEVQKVIIAIPSAPSAVIRKVMNACREEGIEVKTLPAISDMLDRQHLAAQLRDVNLDDLLGRAPVKLDITRIESYLSGRRILVTGAGGSIGSELCRQLGRFRPSLLILFDQAETPLHYISLELERDYPGLAVETRLADVRDAEHVARVFGETRPEVVFHAAACKHVPMMEYHPLEGVKTNILGTRNLAKAAEEAGVERLVMISTDKAVNPTNVMGASKRAAETFVQAFDAQSSTEFITVRFGNVLGSNGSVVPLFQEQIRRGGPVTVTHPDVIRYFMTIPEASQLVLQAGSMGKGGEIFLLDMGEPVKIAELAKDLIRLSGLEPGRDVDIVYTGLRPGEKLFEELLIDGEGIKPTEHRKIMVASARRADLDSVERLIAELAFCVRKGDAELAVQKLREIVPEFRPDDRPSVAAVHVHPAALAPAREP